MAIYDEAVNPDDLLSQDPQYIYFVKALIAAKQKYAKSKSLADGEAVKILRYNALMANINVYDLEQDVFTVMNKRQPTEAEKKAVQPYVQETYLTKQMLDIRALYARTTDGEKREQLHNEAQFIRMQVYGIGVDPYRFESRTFLIYEGKEMSAELQKGQYAYVDKAIQMWNTNAKTTEQKNALRPLIEEEDAYKKRIDVTRLDLRNRYSETYSGADMVVFMAFPGHKPLEIGVASTVSYTTYREKKQVRTMGRVSAKGITKGPRTISGRLIFTIIREHVVEMLRKEIPYLRNLKTILMDELPPFDILVSFGNEYGGSAGLVVQGVTTVDEQKTMSIEDLFTENLFTFLARALEPMRDMNNLDREYDPLEWFTTSFNAPGSEAVANFKPKELQLYQDAELLTDPSPFYGSIAGWDSATYDWSELAANLGIDSSIIDSYQPNTTVGMDPVDGVDGPQEKADLPGVGDNALFVQVVYPYQNKWSLVTKGTIQVYQDGKKIGEAKHGQYTTTGLRDLGYLVTHPQTSSMNKQQFPMRMSQGSSEVRGALFTKIPIVKGKELRISYFDSGGVEIWNHTVSNHYVDDDQMFVLLKTEKKGSQFSANTISNFNLKKVDESNGSYGYWYQSLPKDSITNKGSIKKELDAYMVYSSKIADAVTAQGYTEVGEYLKGYPVRLTWTLDLSRCDTVDAKWNPLEDQQVTKLKALDSISTSSVTSATTWKQQVGTGNYTGRIDKRTNDTGQVTFDLLGTFWTVSKPYKNKRYMIYWEDLPKEAVLTYRLELYSSPDTFFDSKDIVGRVEVAFVKDNTNINKNNPYWKAIGR